MTVICLISFLGVKSLDADKQAMSYGFLAFVLLNSVYWIILGRKIKSNTADLQNALWAIKITIISAFVVFALTLIGMIVRPGGGGAAGLFAFILALYLLVAQSGIKKLTAN